MHDTLLQALPEYTKIMLLLPKENMHYITNELKNKKYNYKILDIDISIKNLFNHQFYVNAIPYIDAKTNQKMILMPIFQEDKFDLELQEKNTKVFESCGYKVIHVKNTAYKNKGGIYCLVNIIE
jgi:hypothetical protein